MASMTRRYGSAISSHVRRSEIRTRQPSGRPHAAGTSGRGVVTREKISWHAATLTAPLAGDNVAALGDSLTLETKRRLRRAADRVARHGPGHPVGGLFLR